MSRTRALRAEAAIARPRVLAAVVAVVVVIGAGLFWFLRDDAPPAVDLDAAVEGTGDGAITADVDDDPTTWTVIASSGDTQSFAGYRVDEELRGIGANTAVGRTPDVEGAISLDGSTLTAAEIRVALADVESDDSRRDNQFRRAVDESTHPVATFVSEERVDLGAGAAAGQPVVVRVPGELTLAGVTRPTTADVEAQLVGDVIVVTGTIDISFAEHGITAPQLGPVLSIEDEGIIEWQLVFAGGSLDGD